nr:hypothetical protein [Tanacetum cinerariifolium]
MISYQKTKAIKTKRLLELGEIKSSKGANQARTFRRSGDIRWGSHLFQSIACFRCITLLLLFSKEIMEKTNILSQSLQIKSQDIVNAIEEA